MIKSYDMNQFSRDLNELGINPDDTILSNFIIYYELLVEWNERMNLTSITGFDEVFKKHFIDSLSLVYTELDLEEGKSLIDIGTGAGFPGLPLKIIYPGLKVTLLDSLNKRVTFLNEVIGRLGLKDIEVIHGRAEDYARKEEKREQYDYCVSRAVSNLSTLSELALPYVKVGGSFIAYKSEKLEMELEESEKALRILGGRFHRKIEFCLPDTDIKRTLCIIMKDTNTNPVYPRKAGIPSKKPIH